VSEIGKSRGTRYSEEFKQGAIKLVLESKQNVAEVCSNLGVSRNAMDRWLADEKDSHNGEKVHLRQLEAENRQLRKDKEDLEDTVEILKKAAAIFSQSQRRNTK